MTGGKEGTTGQHVIRVGMAGSYNEPHSFVPCNAAFLTVRAMAVRPPPSRQSEGRTRTADYRTRSFGARQAAGDHARPAKTASRSVCWM